MKFIDCDFNLEDSNIVIIGIPYDGTSSFRPGSRFAPNEIRQISFGLENYSPFLNLNLKEKLICDLGDLDLPFGNKKIVLEIISKKIMSYLKKHKKIVSIGGEHLISYPIVNQYLKIYPDMAVIQLDAHADLRDEYLGEIYSHATVMRRIYEKTKENYIYQFAIRSGIKEEFDFGKKYCNFYPYDLTALKKVLFSFDKTQPIYLTIDLDVLDPAFFPGTGTPEPGGISFIDLINALYLFSGYNIVGVDIVELAPHYDFNGVSAIVAAKILREILLVI